MPVLGNIFPAAGNTAFAEDEKSIAPPNAGQAGAESFDDVMSRAQSPPGANVAAAQNRRLRTSFAGAQKRNPVDSSQPPAPVKAGKDSPAVPADPLATVKIKAGAKADDQHGQSADTPAQTGADAVTDALPNLAANQPAPPLPAWLLNLSAPAAAAKSTANNPVAAAVLPFGVAEKNGAAPVKNLPAPKTDLQAGGLSAAALKLSVLAGTEAGGDSAPQKIEAVPADAAQPDSSIVLKNPAGESAANNPVAAAVLPFGGAEKNGAVWVKNLTASKTDSQTGGLSAAAPEKIEAVPADDSPLDDPGQPVVLQNPAAESAAFAPAKPHGTSAAKQDVPMKNTDQTNKVAGPGEKVLPGGAIPAARENNLPGRASAVPVSARVTPLEADAATVPAAQDGTVRSAGPADDAAAVSSFSDIRSQALERAHDLMAWHATRLVGANSDSLQVVIKPDAGTQLSLELRQRGGGIEAQAILQKGDFENLKQHWPELQQRLEQRGIKLAPLAGGENSAAWSGSQGFKNRQDRPAELEPVFPGAFAGFAPPAAANILPDEPAIQAASSRGWQTWA
jgi:hypothetical protein